MDIDPNKLWNDAFGPVNQAKDFTGREIRKDAYGKKTSPYGWDKEHILPLALNGPDVVENIQIAHIETNRAKGEDNPFVINHIRYFIKKVKNYKEGDRVANYNYNNKKYFIMIAEDQNNV
jgi:hypothetical protein